MFKTSEKVKPKFEKRVLVVSDNLLKDTLKSQATKWPRYRQFQVNSLSMDAIGDELPDLRSHWEILLHSIYAHRLKPE